MNTRNRRHQHKLGLRKALRPDGDERSARARAATDRILRDFFWSTSNPGSEATRESSGGPGSSVTGSAPAILSVNESRKNKRS